MKLDAVIAALGLPDSAMVNQRIPKKMLAEKGASTTAHRRSILEDIEELQWLAALKPINIAVPQYSDDTRVYGEIAVISLVLRPVAKTTRMAELMHRAVPYPVLLLISQENRLSVSMVHIRLAQNEADKTVLDGDAVLAQLPETGHAQSFLDAMALTKQPRTDLFALYQSWIDTVTALEAAEITGHFKAGLTRAKSQARHQALQQCRTLQMQIHALRTTARKERQLARQVALNNEIRGLSAELAAAMTILN